MRLVEKAVRISGSARGMGREMMRLLSDDGAIVIGGDTIERESVTPPNAEDVSLDVTKEESWGVVVDKIVSKHGRIDVLVNNADVLVTDDNRDLTHAEWERSIRSIRRESGWECALLSQRCNDSETDRSSLGAKSQVPAFMLVTRRKER